VARDPEGAENAARVHFDNSIKTLLSTRTNRPTPAGAPRE
jgi:hypothetical protein